VCFAVLCVPFCFIVMYVVSLFSMVSYCLVGLYYLSYVCFVLYGCFLFFSVPCYCIVCLFYCFFSFFFLYSVCVFCTCILNTATG
jgi:hypothetical protein